MQAVLALLVAGWLLHHGAGRPWIAAGALFAATWAATTLPDLDLALGLGHRSGLTHSVLPAALAGARRRWWPLAAGLALGLGLHLSADVFPNAMRGYATVKLPGAGSIGPAASYWWLAVNALAALAAGAWLTIGTLPARAALAALGMAALIGVTYLFRTDGGWAALALFAGVAWLIHRALRAQ